MKTRRNRQKIYRLLNRFTIRKTKVSWCLLRMDSVAEVVVAAPQVSGQLAADGILEPAYLSDVQVDDSLERIAANGGAVGSVVLGVWSIAGSFLTTWSLINGVIGVLLGFWGTASRRPRMAWIGIGLSILGVLLSMMEISSLIQEFFQVPDEDLGM